MDVHDLARKIDVGRLKAVRLEQLLHPVMGSEGFVRLTWRAPGLQGPFPAVVHVGGG